MSVISAESETLDAVYLGCGDLKSWFRMLGTIADLVGADAMACCHDHALPPPERVFTVSNDAVPDEGVYERVMARASRTGPVPGTPASCTMLDPAEGQEGYWLLLRDAPTRTGAVFILQREASAFTGQEAEKSPGSAPICSGP